MPPKRKNAEGEGNTGRERKKQRVAGARTIAVLSVRQLGVSGDARDRLSKPAAPQGMQGLPNAVDIEKFVEVLFNLCTTCLLSDVLHQARAFEINAMENAIKNAR